MGMDAIGGIKTRCSVSNFTHINSIPYKASSSGPKESAINSTTLCLLLEKEYNMHQSACITVAVFVVRLED